MSTKQLLRKRWTEEPGLSIGKKVREFWLSVLDNSQGRNTEELFSLLDGLPFREEVPGGRDLRGSGVGVGSDMDFSNTDFSYARSIGKFYRCDLSNASFNEIVAERASFGNIVKGSSFRRAKLRSCYIMEADARNCCFDDAIIKGMSFHGSDLHGSSFRDADCRGVCFINANLTNCDLRGANLEQAVFKDVQIDKSTDLRGASLINVFSEDQFDKNGKLVARGVDLRHGMFDATTKFGENPSAVAIEVLEAARRVARERGGQQAGRICDAIAVFEERVKASFWDGWAQDLGDSLSEEDRAAWEEILDDAFEAML